MLTGQNGILTNAQNAKIGSIYSKAEEQVKLAYMSVKTEIMTQKTINSNYDAQSNGSELAQIILKDLTGTNSTNTEWTKCEYSSASNTIDITYSNSTLKKDAISIGVPQNDGEVKYQIIIEKQDAILETNIGELVAGYVIGDYVDINGEGFYVIEDSPPTATTVKLLAEKNIDGSQNKQSDTVINYYGWMYDWVETDGGGYLSGWCPYANFLEPYREALNADEIRLLSIAEIDVLNGVATDGEPVEGVVLDANFPTWAANSTYWVGSVVQQMYEGAYWIVPESPAKYYYNAAESNSCGLRPVIVMQKSNIPN